METSVEVEGRSASRLLWVACGIVVVLFLPFVSFLGLFVFGIGSMSAGASAAVPPGGSCVAESVYEPGVGGRDVNLSVAQTAYDVATSRGVSDRALLALFETGLVESNFRNLANDGVRGPEDGGTSDAELAIAGESMKLPNDGVGTDHTSVGFVQQQNSWGSVGERLDPAFATAAFLDVLDRVEGSTPGSAGALAQAVQRSALPSAYDAREADAKALLARIKAEGSGSDLAESATVAVRSVSAGCGADEGAVAPGVSIGVLGSGKWVTALPGAVLTSGYGPRGCPIGVVCNEFVTFHYGVDLATPGGDGTIVAPADMEITAVVNSNDSNGSYVMGRLVDEPRYVMAFHHVEFDSIKVRLGDVVAPGTPLAAEGTTGNSTGEHLHWQIMKPGSQGDFWMPADVVDPMPILKAKGIL